METIDIAIMYKFKGFTGCGATFIWLSWYLSFLTGNDTACTEDIMAEDKVAGVLFWVTWLEVLQVEKEISNIE